MDLSVVLIHVWKFKKLNNDVITMNFISKNIFYNKLNLQPTNMRH